MFEAEALFGSPLTPGRVVAHPTASLVTLAIQVRITAIVDVSDPAQAGLIDSNAQELTGDWRGYQQRSSATSVAGPTGKAPTQEFGEQLFTACPDVQGILTLSARLPYYRILVVYPQRLRKDVDYVRYSTTDSRGQTLAFEIP
jgi:hypothetical protein